jgi:hypothetical protein
MPCPGRMDPGMVEHWKKYGSIGSQILVHHRSQSRGGVGWSPAPAAADAAIGQFCEALHKRPHCYHVFAIPFLMTNRWSKTLLKAVDVYFVLKLCVRFGITHRMNHLASLFICPSADMNLGVSGTPSQWWTWRAPYEKCRTLISYRKGIFCANLFTGRGNWKPRQKAWCGNCHIPLKGNHFPVRLPKD